MFLLFPIHFKYSAKKGIHYLPDMDPDTLMDFLKFPCQNLPPMFQQQHIQQKTYISSKVFQVFQHMDTMFASGPTFDISTLQMSSTTKHAVSPVPPINPTKSPWGWSPISVVPALHPAFVAPLQLVVVPKEWPR
jgi:hypothetical protein